VNGITYLVYVQNYQTIVRRRVPDGAVTTLLSVTGNYATERHGVDHRVAPVQPLVFPSRRVFSLSEHGRGNRRDGGLCECDFTADAGIYPVRYVWEPIDALAPVAAPSRHADSVDPPRGDQRRNFHGVLRLSASTLQGQPGAVTPAAILNFVDGVWSGSILLHRSGRNVVVRPRMISAWSASARS